jgi:thiamine biosynthesis lipoprotein
MELTLNGIAQGFAADRVQAVLKGRGVEHALIDSGELASLGTNQGGRPWTAGIQHPREPDAYVALARLDGRSLATSGDYASRFSPDDRSHHLFDPRTGQSATSLTSVSVAAPTGMLADALSTALFVLGPEQGQKLIAQISGADAFLVTAEGQVTRTPGFPTQLT